MMQDLDPMRAAMERLTTLPRRGTPAAELSDRERIALGIAAGAPYTVHTVGGQVVCALDAPIGIADRGDGGYIIAVGRACARIVPVA